MIKENKTRQKILETAARLFSKRGYFGISMDEIAGELGLAKSAIYYHFESKEELFKELMEQALEQLKNELSKAVEKSALPTDYLFNIAKTILDFRIKRPEIALLMSLGVGDDKEQPILQFVSQMYLELIKFIRDLIFGAESFRLFAYKTVSSLSITILSFALSPFLPNRDLKTFVSDFNVVKHVF